MEARMNGVRLSWREAGRASRCSCSTRSRSTAGSGGAARAAGGAHAADRAGPAGLRRVGARRGGRPAHDGPARGRHGGAAGSPRDRSGDGLRRVDGRVRRVRAVAPPPGAGAGAGAVRHAGGGGHGGGAPGPAQLAIRVRREGHKAAVDAMLPNLISATTRREHPEVEGRLREIAESIERRPIVRALEGLAGRPDSTGLLPTITVPAPGPARRRGCDVPLEESRAMAERSPVRELRIVEGAGHLPTSRRRKRSTPSS